MIVELVPRLLVCPNGCGERARDVVTPDGVPFGGGAATLHNCGLLAGLSVPMVPEGVRAEVRANERGDYVGSDRVQTDADGRVVMSVTVERDEGTDCVVFAPCATAKGDI
jgi:hypothetical protein